tara:strand:+ start:266 stop:394 length:129 start_codon:yes stop_codon:yes gene_type:complete
MLVFDMAVYNTKIDYKKIEIEKHIIGNNLATNLSQIANSLKS